MYNIFSPANGHRGNGCDHAHTSRITTIVRLHHDATHSDSLNFHCVLDSHFRLCMCLVLLSATLLTKRQISLRRTSGYENEMHSVSGQLQACATCVAGEMGVTEAPSICRRPSRMREVLGVMGQSLCCGRVKYGGCVWKRRLAVRWLLNRPSEWVSSS